MQHTNLGRSGLTVSRLVLGTMNFGPHTTESDSFSIMDSAIDSGINFFDTANVYGGDRKGHTEEIVGNWFTESGRRDEVVLATKVYGQTAEHPNGKGVSAKQIRFAVEESLRRLQTDHIDLYQMHHIDRSTPWEELWQAMDVLVAQGKILYVGSSNFAGWHLAQANEAASRRHSYGLISEQSKYSLITRDIELEVLPAAQAYGIGVISWSPLEGGLLGGVLAKAESGRRSKPRVRERIESLRPQLEQWEQLCADLGHGPGDVALAWQHTRPGITGPIVGPRTMDQLDGARRALDINLDESTLARIDEIFPGPGGPAPEAYAW
ncbi:aldo/keto reductase [Propionibacteriaceae bacterium Y1700]|uniref:aldo/keto reductase n=1 Tax=Microlunatus sp. Y1700 TaxID=3418487 RepID=UPI003DA75ECB